MCWDLQRLLEGAHSPLRYTGPEHRGEAVPSGDRSARKPIVGHSKASRPDAKVDGPRYYQPMHPGIAYDVDTEAAPRA